jgi:serine/threonine protein kinase
MENENSSSLETLVCDGKTYEAIQELKDLIEHLHGDPRTNLISLSSRFNIIKREKQDGVVDYNANTTESNKIRVAFLNLLSDLREEIQGKINFFKPIPHKEDNQRSVLRAFVEIVLSKKYKNIKAFGDGNTFAYFDAQEHYSDMPVMIMVMKTHDFDRAHYLSCLQRIAQLKHRNLIQLLDVNFQSHPYYLITEFVSGVDLKTLLRDTGPFPLHNAKRFLLIIGDVMDTLRLKRFTHAGIRPSKILIDHELEPEISPFDILKIDNKKRLLESFIEDCYYFAPEVLYDPPSSTSQLYAKQSEKPACDVDKTNQFCLAALGFELITGYKLFEGTGVDEILKSRDRFFSDKVYREERFAHKDLPKRMADILKKMLNFNPQKRYTDLKSALLDIGRVRALLDENEAQVLASYKRCLNNEEDFVGKFYANLVAEPSAGGFKFNDKNSIDPEITRKLNTAIHIIFDADDNGISFLEKIVELSPNSNKIAEEYQLIFDVFMKTVFECDPRWEPNDEVDKAWRKIKQRITRSLNAYLAEKAQSLKILKTEPESTQKEKTVKARPNAAHAFGDEPYHDTHDNSPEQNSELKVDEEIKLPSDDGQIQKTTDAE